MNQSINSILDTDLKNKTVYMETAVLDGEKYYKIIKINIKISKI